MKNKYLFISLFLIFFFSGCREKSLPVLSLNKSGAPLFTLGEENSDHNYKWITKPIVDRAGKIYLWDELNFEHIDVFDGQGQFLFQFGRQGQGPGEFRGVAVGAVDSLGNIWLKGGGKGFVMFSEQEKYLRNIELPKDIETVPIKKMMFDSNDDLFLLYKSRKDAQFILSKFIIKENRCRLIHSDSLRTHIQGTDMFPDFTLDEEGNVYVTGVFDYRIFKYSKKGELLSTYEERGFKKERIIEEDTNVFSEDFKIIRQPDFRAWIKNLKGPSLYFPAVFGVNVDEGKIYIWTSKQDEMKRFIVDVYDMKFNKICRSRYFNLMGRNLAQIVKGRLYIPSIENENIQLTKNVGRLFMLNYCDHLNVYAVSEELGDKH